MADEHTHQHDPTFYRSPRDAAAGPPEKLAYVASFSRPADQPDGIAVVDTDPNSAGYGSVIGFTELPNLGDELHHFGWNACSSALCPTGSHTHGDRRYLVVPGIRSSRIYILDTLENPAAPKVVKVLGQFEEDRGDQHLAYDVWWHINDDVIVTSEWGTPSMIEDGIVPELLLGRKYGHRLHFWDMSKRRHVQTVDLGDEHQMALELRPAHDPARRYGFVGVVVSVEDLSASIWLWHAHDGQWAATKVISIPAEPAPAEKLPPLLQGFGAVPPLVTDLALSVDDRFLYVSCWGTGELKQYDVSDPFHPRDAGSVRIGGIARRAPHPARPAQPLAGGPQMVEVSRDGRRVYFTNSLYGAWDEQFYPDGVGAWMTKLDVGDGGGMTFDQRFFLEGEVFRGRRVHQIRLEGGDASSDSYCYS